MSEQLALTLTPRQQAVYDLACRFPDGITADEAGAEAHTVPGPRGGKTHPPDQRCDYCTREGDRLCGQLVKLGRLRRKRGGPGTGYVYVVADARDLVGEPQYDPSTAPWPKGF